jgi:NADH-quinone oxidoreductase subunit J
MEIAIFVIFAALAVVSAVTVVAHRNPVHSTVSLVVTFFSTAVLYVLLGAPFLGALQLLLYTGAILVLFLFVLMLLNIQRERAGTATAGLPQLLVSVLAAVVFAGVIGVLSWQAYASLPITALTPEYVSIKGLAQVLFSTYLLPFEMIGLLLLVAVVAATVLARKPPQSDADDASAESNAGAQPEASQP